MGRIADAVVRNVRPEASAPNKNTATPNYDMYDMITT